MTSTAQYFTACNMHVQRLGFIFILFRQSTASICWTYTRGLEKTGSLHHTAVWWFLICVLQKWASSPFILLWVWKYCKPNTCQASSPCFGWGLDQYVLGFLCFPTIIIFHTSSLHKVTFLVKSCIGNDFFLSFQAPSIFSIDGASLYITLSKMCFFAMFFINNVHLQTC